MPSTKELQSEIDEQTDTITEAVEILEAVYTPESTRSDLVEAVADALAVLSGDAEEEGEEDEEEEE